MFKIVKKVNSLSGVATSSTKLDNDSNVNNYFKDLNVYILPNGMGKNRVELFKNALLKHGAILLNENSELEFKDSDSLLSYLIIVDENTIKTWNNMDKALL